MQIGVGSIITSEQIRAARNAIKWTLETLAGNSDVSVRTLKSVEMQTGIPNCRTVTLGKIQNSLEAAGIEFIGGPEDRPGIRIGKLRQ